MMSDELDLNRSQGSEFRVSTKKGSTRYASVFLREGMLLHVDSVGHDIGPPTSVKAECSGCLLIAQFEIET